MIQIALINYLFGGSLPIMGVFLTMVGPDITTDYIEALKRHTGSLPLTFKACLQSLSSANNTLRDYKSYFFSYYDKIFVTMIRKLGGC
ncbi:hypothetical protein [Enterococcus sp. DIV0187]|uniref:hypothetical protein n=1 Tax=Enterococcus sp. DIV0187 TaxID=2774644 RepID=UPI003F22331F